MTASRSRFVVPALVCIALFGAGQVACAGPAKREAAALASAVERYQRADNVSKPRYVDPIAKVECTDPEVCRARDACLAAAEPIARALVLKDEVTVRLADIEAKRLAPDAPEAEALPGKLDEAAHLLLEGRSKMPDCEKQVTDLRVKYGV